MDARTQRLLASIQGYLDNPPPGLPEQLVDQITSTQEMLTAPRYSEESPGERSAREAAERTMPEDVYNEMYADQPDVTQEVGL